jgi:hypothetical protein
MREACHSFFGEIKKQGQPFFFAVGLVKPHLSFNASQKYWEMNKQMDIDVTSPGFKPSL